jgi:hypothetical protein
MWGGLFMPVKPLWGQAAFLYSLVGEKHKQMLKN